MRMVRSLQLIMLICAVTAWDLDEQLESDYNIQTVNSAGTTWSAGRNFHASLKKDYLRYLVDIQHEPARNRLPKYVPKKGVGDLPAEFDSRTQWPACGSIGDIRDQGPCAGGWAVAAVSAFSDRLCINSSSKMNLKLSTQNLLSCCSNCGFGCGGCESGVAWESFYLQGVVTGGKYKSKQGCQPYQLPPCEHTASNKRKSCSSYNETYTPACETSCYNKKYKKSYAKDIHKLNTVFWIENNPAATQQEIFKNGPLEADMWVYEDFLSYKSGVYQHTTGHFLGGHCVKLLGWGVSNGTPYWMAANSWNTNWGDKGFFKIKRGTDECGIEENINGGMP